MAGSNESPLSVPPVRLLRAVREELNRALPPEQKRLMELVGVSDFLACAAVIRRERVAGRLILRQHKVEEAVALMRSAGLYCHRAGFDCLTGDECVRHTEHKGRFVERGRHAGAKGVIYFGVSEEFAEGAELLEVEGEHAFVGELFGYPRCCTKFFTECEGVQQDKTAFTIPDRGPFPRGLNPVSPYLYGLHFLFHFPCSPRCAASLEILERNRAYLAGLSPSSLEFHGFGAGIALYGPQVGIALVTRYEQAAEDTYLAREVHARDGSLLATSLQGRGDVLIKIYTPHRFEVGGTLFEDIYSFAARFI